MFFKSLICATVLLAYCVLGAVVTPQLSGRSSNDSVFIARDEETSNLPPKCQDKHQNSCTYNPKGHVKMHFSDKQLNYGTVSMAKLVQSLRNHCDENSLCNPQKFSIPTQVIAPNGVAHDEATVTVNMATQVWNDGQLDNLLDVLEKALSSFTTGKHVKYSPCAGSDCNVCDCSHFEHKLQFHGPAEIEIETLETPHHDRQVISFYMTYDYNDSTLTCSEFATVGGAISGAIDGIAGGIYTLLGLVCGDA